METPTFYFYNDDLQANGSVSDSAVSRECCFFDPPITTKLISELKHLKNSNEPISVRVGDKDVFKVQFIDETKK